VSKPSVAELLQASAAAVAYSAVVVYRRQMEQLRTGLAAQQLTSCPPEEVHVEIWLTEAQEAGQENLVVAGMCPALAFCG